MNLIENSIIAFSAGALIGYVYFWIWKPRREAAKVLGDNMSAVVGISHWATAEVLEARMRVLHEFAETLRKEGKPHFHESPCWNNLAHNASKRGTNVPTIDDWRAYVARQIENAPDDVKFDWVHGEGESEARRIRLDIFLPVVRQALAARDVDRSSKIALELMQRARIASEYSDVDTYEIGAYVQQRIRTATEDELRPTKTGTPEWQTRPIE